MLRHLPLLAALVAGGFVFAGCDHDHDDEEHEHEHDGEDPIAEGCPHLEYGPDVSLDLSGEVTAISVVHTRYLITLADEGDGYGGTVPFTSTGSDYYFLFDREVPFELDDASGAEVAVTHTMTDPAACEVAAVVYHFEALAAGDYSLTFGPTDEQSLQMAVHVPGADHSHAHE